MNAEQYNRVYQAVLVAHNQGIKICTGSYGVMLSRGQIVPTSANCACALGCFLLGKKPSMTYILGFAGEAEIALNAHSTDEIVSFTSGFDRIKFHPSYSREWFDAGKRMRAQLECEGIMSK